MKLVGRSELHALARTTDRDLRDAVLALCAELEATNWRTINDIRSAFPHGRLAGCHLTIDLDERHCLIVAFNIKAGIALVEFAGPSTKVKRKRSAI